MKKVAVTGSLASGKTTICKLFSEWGAYVISADAIVHQLLTPTTSIGQNVIGLLGNEIVVNELISREEIAKKVFRDPSLLEEIEKLIHPEVQKVIETKYQEISEKTFPLFIAEIPLLYESNSAPFYDYIIVMTAEKKSRIKRFMATTSCDQDEFERREKRFIPIKQKQLWADLVFENNGSLNQLEQFAKKTFNHLKGKIL